MISALEPMKKSLAAFAILIVLTATSVWADDDIPGFRIWSAGDLAVSGEDLESGLANHLAFEKLGDFGGHYALIVYRDASGEAEYHETETDFYVVQRGEATLIVGGEMVDARQTAPGELRGPSIRNGRSIRLEPGHVVNIPPTVPHQIVLDEGATFTYFILKVKAANR